jgi:hypothetical protein
MLHLAWFDWDMAKSSSKFAVQVNNDQPRTDEGVGSQIGEPEETTTFKARAEIRGNGRIALTARVVDGSGFKTLVSDQPMPKGGKYFF